MIARPWLVRTSALALLAVACTSKAPPGTELGEKRSPITYECRDSTVLEAPERPAYRFEIDGLVEDPWVISLAGRPSQPAAGDIIHVGRFSLVLDRPGHHRYSVADHGERVSLAIDGGPERVVALEVADPTALAALTPEERRGLRGIRLRTSKDATLAELATLDLERVVVSYDQVGTRELSGPFLPAGLPDELRYLELELFGGPSVLGGLAPAADEAPPPDPITDPVTGLAGLRRLTKLRHLVIYETTTGSGAAALDLDALRGLTALEHLRVNPFSRELAHPEALGALTGLHALDLSGVVGIGGLEPIASLPGLRWLDVSRAEVSSLAPLGGHPSLEIIEANGTGVTELPTATLPALRDLTLLAAPVDADAVARFAALVPKARVAHGWNQTLADTTTCADRLRVRTGGLCHREPTDERTLFETRDPAHVQEFLPLLYVQEDEPMGTCMCCGEPTIELYRGERLVAELGFHHGQSLRWRGWPSDRRLAEADADALCRWLEHRGATQACADRKPAAPPE